MAPWILTTCYPGCSEKCHLTAYLHDPLLPSSFWLRFLLLLFTAVFPVPKKVPSTQRSNNNPLREVLLSSWFFRWGNWGLAKLSNLPRGYKPLARNRPTSVWPQNPHLCLPSPGKITSYCLLFLCIYWWQLSLSGSFNFSINLFPGILNLWPPLKSSTDPSFLCAVFSPEFYYNITFSPLP